ncbi:MAG: pilus assembly protein [Alphaproteobacteria bacterium]|nr:MAG: pilus assembly protein [Alphaproteobacteria bacterium]
MFAQKLFKRLTLRRFAKARSGSAAVEFALVLAPFFLLTFALAEVAMIGFAQTSLDNGVSRIARLVRTGQAQMGGLGEAQIKARLCQEMSSLLAVDCAANLFLDVNRFASFTAASQNNSPIQNGEFQEAGFSYRDTQPSDIVVVRAYYRWQVMTPMFQPVFQNVNGGKRILVATMMFRNEPYQ